MSMAKEMGMANSEMSKGNVRGACKPYMSAQNMSMMKSDMSSEQEVSKPSGSTLGRLFVECISVCNSHNADKVSASLRAFAASSADASRKLQQRYAPT
jgi:hypothetical protein